MSTQKPVRTRHEAATVAPLRLEVAPTVGPLRCPHCEGTSFRREALHHIGRGTTTLLALYTLFSGVISFLVVSVATDLISVLAVVVSPLVLGALTVIGLLFFGGRIDLHICRRCGYAFVFGAPRARAANDGNARRDETSGAAVRSAKSDDDQKIIL